MLYSKNIFICHRVSQKYTKPNDLLINILVRPHKKSHVDTEFLDVAFSLRRSLELKARDQ